MPPVVVVDPRLENTIDVELEAVRRQLDFARFERLMRMDAQKYGKLSDTERRLMLTAAEGFAKRFNEQVSMMRRNLPRLKTPWPLKGE